MSLNLRIQPLNEHSFLIAPAFASDVDIADRAAGIHELTALLESSQLDGVIDLVPAYETVALFFVDIDSRHRAEKQLKSLEFAAGKSVAAASRLHEIPVVYDGVDLHSAASELQMSVDELIALHSGAEYTVAMVGFLPGFPYLLGMDPRLSLPRLETPRPSVPKGSVAIGGAQTGIYPAQSPGGWRLIGVTDVELFDASRAEPSLLRAGDRLRFVRESD